MDWETEQLLSEKPGGVEKVQKNAFSIKKFMVIIAVFLTLAIGLSLYYEIRGIKRQYEKVALHTAESYFNAIIALRKWNALHGGVYVPVTDKVQPNPYLDDPLRDLETVNGLKLTKINPAYMTRLFSEIANKDLEIKFHIASLKPINPKNAADPWEKEALEFLEKGTASIYAVSKLDSSSYFRYMAPLKIEESCLNCHAKQGYKVGDVKGGIAISLPYEPFQKAQKSNIQWTIFRYQVFLILLGVVVYIFGKKSFLTQKKLEHLASVDELTGLKNRRHLMERLTEEAARSLRYGHDLSLIIMDIDKFKEINDKFGHLAGDEALQQVAQAILDNVRNVDIAGRYGGDEFVIVLPETPLQGAMETAERIRCAVPLAVQMRGADGPFQVTTSLGAAGLPGNISSDKAADWFLNKADEALYEAKGRGGNMVFAFNSKE